MEIFENCSIELIDGAITRFRNITDAASGLCYTIYNNLDGCRLKFRLEYDGHKLHLVADDINYCKEAISDARKRIVEAEQYLNEICEKIENTEQMLNSSFRNLEAKELLSGEE